jgi:bifunctional ADP-heptose synthase (sugar kinase/adenylyltransferase)
MAILGFTASAFDVLHAGHIAMLEEAGTCPS